jgi:hypothetical protein
MKGNLKTTGLDIDSESSHGETKRISYKQITDPEDELEDIQGEKRSSASRTTRATNLTSIRMILTAKTPKKK